MDVNEVKRICLWSGPRNISTAMMYSFAQRTDTVVYDEPLYAAYLSRFDAKDYHPGAQEILDSMEQNAEKVIEMILGPHPRPIALFKQMTHHLLEVDWSFLRHTVNVILTRDPIEMLPSYAKQVKNPTMQDVGYALHFKLLDQINTIGQDPLVLDSRKVLENPPGVLSLLCDKIGIPFDEKMLHWQKGARKEDGVWARFWYRSVHESTGFQPYKPKDEPFPEHLRPLLEECMPYYAGLKALSIG
jgi:hypothetical protein